VDLRYRVPDAGQVFQVALGVVGTAVLAVGAADSVGHGAAPEPGAGQLAAGLAVCARVLSKYYICNIQRAFFVKATTLYRRGIRPHDP
jgi:hypothetical protein